MLIVSEIHERDTLEQNIFHVNKSHVISCYARSILNINTNSVPLIRLEYCHFRS